MNVLIKSFSTGCLLVACFFATHLNAEPVTVLVDPERHGLAVSPVFTGLSYETKTLLPNERGVHYFRPDNEPLINAFKTLGVKSLRIGGNSVDAPKVAIPVEDDVRSLFEFARKAGVKIIYSVRLQDGDPASAARIARYIHGNFADCLNCFAIGNEPSYYKDYSVYHEKWKAIADAILAAVPDAKFCGPDQNPDPVLCKKMVEDFSSQLKMLTEHNYPGGCAYKNPKAATVQELIPIDAAVAREKLLANDFYRGYDKILKGMAEAVARTPLAFRLTEFNSFWYGGLSGASDSFASALWALDGMYWWASHGAAGVNFHTGDRVGGGDKSLPSRYAAFVTGTNGYDFRPLAYGMTMFSLGARGDFLPLEINPSPDSSLKIYALLAQGTNLSVTIINLAHDANASTLKVEIKIKEPFRPVIASAMALQSPNHDAAAQNGITLGGKSINADGSWNGGWHDLDVSPSANSLAVEIPPLSATLLRVQLKK